MTARDLLESDAVHAFAVFAQHRNFTAAAAALNISQPSLHVKIKKLADGLGLELYQRRGRGLVLTPVGERLAAFAQDSMRRVDDVLGVLHEDTPVVRIAAGRAALRWVISGAVQAISRSGRAVSIITANREAALAAVTSGQADIAVVAVDPPPSPLKARRIAAYPQLLVVNSRHPLADRTQVRLSELDGMDLLLPPPGRPHRRAVDRGLQGAGAACRVVAEVDGWDLLVHFAALGLGATIVNGCVQLPSRLRGIPVADLPAVRYWAAWRAQRQPALAAVLAQLPSQH